MRLERIDDGMSHALSLSVEVWEATFHQLSKADYAAQIIGRSYSGNPLAAHALNVFHATLKDPYCS